MAQHAIAGALVGADSAFQRAVATYGLNDDPEGLQLTVLVEMGDRRTAAMQLCKVFRSVRITN
jgi:hypothetical protein